MQNEIGVLPCQKRQNMIDIPLQAGFQTVRYATISIPTYSTGQIGMYVCKKQQQQQQQQPIDQSSWQRPPQWPRL